MYTITRTNVDLYEEILKDSYRIDYVGFWEDAETQPSGHLVKAFPTLRDAERYVERCKETEPEWTYKIYEGYGR